MESAFNSSKLRLQKRSAIDQKRLPALGTLCVAIILSGLPINISNVDISPHFSVTPRGDRTDSQSTAREKAHVSTKVIFGYCPITSSFMSLP